MILFRPNDIQNGTISNCQVSGFVEGTPLDKTMKWKEDGIGGEIFHGS
jgi:hypothetical protein